MKIYVVTDIHDRPSRERFFYVYYGVSYYDLKEIMAGRRVEIDHATLNHWVEKFSSLIAANA